MELKVIDLAAYLAVADKLDCEPSKLTEQLGPELIGLCKEVSRALKEAGAVVVKDPRCSAEENNRFIEMMERYYESPEEYKRPQERPNFHYQSSLADGVSIRAEPYIGGVGDY
uniref:Non-haem dioxygenase N-terminal domain-containing protein n=1 Tax=Fagus sylvatica TaxID=28930 RepID=A0A2N9FU37_FAGSY